MAALIKALAKSIGPKLAIGLALGGGALGRPLQHMHGGPGADKSEVLKLAKKFFAYVSVFANGTGVSYGGLTGGNGAAARWRHHRPRLRHQPI